MASSVIKYKNRFGETNNRIMFTTTFSNKDYDLYNNFVFLYGEDVVKKFILESMRKAVDKREFLEFTLFDDVDDFFCSRVALCSRK